MSHSPSLPHPLTLLAAPGPLPAALAALEGALRSVESLSAVHDAAADAAGPAVLLLTDALPGDAGAVRRLPPTVVVVTAGADAGRRAAQAERRFFALEDAAGEEAALRAVRAAARHSGALLAAERERRRVAGMKTQVRELNRVGMALMSERDPDRLLNLILTQARRLTTSDAGSLYLMETSPEGEPMLRFRLAHNDSIPEIPVPDFTLPVDTSSIAGYAASTGEPLLLDDAYALPADAPFDFNRGFDDEYGYRAKSMLVVPMKDHHDRVVGVLQLINRKRDPDASIRDEASAMEHVLPFGDSEVQTVQSLAGQAAVSIENGQLYRSIENLFEGFIKAAVTAIDQRDPTTSGHSVRVATLTCDLARLIDRADRGAFRSVRFSREQMQELRYAGLLHDFGKVGVREEVLVKSKKLPPVMLERIEARFDVIRSTLEASTYREKVERLLKDGNEGAGEVLRRLDAELAGALDRVDRFQAAVREANEPRILPEEAAGILQEIAETSFPGAGGAPVPCLTPEELHFLSISRGSLDPEERRQIESHVTFTYRFLREIPWTENLAGVADIAHGHHEKLDGSGYPRGVSGAAIPVQTRIMTVSDIFDALTASDRPYKKALPESRALEILEMEASAGQLDTDVVALLLESEAYRRILERDWREF